jgi:hypothetical protein
MEKEYRKIIPFTIALKKNKTSRNKLNKSCERPLQEKDKLLKKEIEEDCRSWKDMPYSWIGRINIMKMAILPKAICVFDEIPIKFQ